MAAGLRNKGLSATVLLGGLAALLALGLVWPLADLAGLVVSEGVDAASFLTPYNLRSIVNTVVMGAAVAFAATVLGFIVSYAITATRVPGRGALKVLFLAPLFAPSIMPAIGLIYRPAATDCLSIWTCMARSGSFWPDLSLHCRIR